MRGCCCCKWLMSRRVGSEVDERAISINQAATALLLKRAIVSSDVLYARRTSEIAVGGRRDVVGWCDADGWMVECKSE